MKQLFLAGACALFFLLSATVTRGEESPILRLEPVDVNMSSLAEVLTPQSLVVDRDFLISNFTMNNAKNFKADDFARIKSMLPQLTDYQVQMLSSANYKDPTTMLIISIFLGGLGVDRFMLGETGIGVVKLITAGGLGIWWLIDLFSIENKTREYNMKLFNEAIQNEQLTLPAAR